MFAFLYFALGDRSKKIFLLFMSKTVLPMFLSMNFMVYGLTFRPLIYFVFIFIYRMKGCSDLIVLHRCPVFLVPFVEETLISPLYILASFVVD